LGRNDDVTDKRLPKIRAGRSVIAFYYRKDMAAVSGALEHSKTDTGSMKVSSIELTMLDLVRYPRAAGGVDNIATIISDLGERIDPVKLASLSAALERSIIQRLGYLLESGGPPRPRASVTLRYAQNAATAVDRTRTITGG
jgi:predicted transcriptional regulator of viral defense system